MSFGGDQEKANHAAAKPPPSGDGDAGGMTAECRRAVRPSPTGGGLCQLARRPAHRWRGADYDDV
jgi:hypothetical protein